jgi:hypothetical protein
MGGKSRKQGTMSEKLIERLEKKPLEVVKNPRKEEKRMVDEILERKEDQILKSIAADAKAFLTIQKDED